MRIFNTLTGQKEEFLLPGSAVKMYVCGVTPYDQSHLGHAMSYIVFDVIRRYLEYRGFQVHHVQNFTDVDDKLIDRGHRLGISPLDLADQMIRQYFDDVDALGIQRAHVYPRVTQEIPAIIDLVRTLVDRGNAYQADGDVYFRVRKLPDYGKLSHRILDGMQAGARIEVDEAKEDPLDFVLWKAAKPGEPAWESPWGPGRPGWHIECSAMSIKYLGEQLDIHGGGQDLVFPHHENEVAQSEAATGVVPFSRFWLHNGLLRMGEEKMSKSLGNLITIQDALSRYTPDGIRLFMLGSHYRSPLTYSEENIAAAQRGGERLVEALRAGDSAAPSGQVDPAPFRERFIAAMDDDFNTSQALAALFDLAREINRGRTAGASVAAGQAALRALGGVLGLRLEPQSETDHLGAAPFIDLLLEVRQELRGAKAYAVADRIRTRLADLGIAVEDTPQGALWRERRE